MLYTPKEADDSMIIAMEYGASQDTVFFLFISL